jgi:hypothetical protein
LHAEIIRLTHNPIAAAIGAQVGAKAGFELLNGVVIKIARTEKCQLCGGVAQNDASQEPILTERIANDFGKDRKTIIEPDSHDALSRPDCGHRLVRLLRPSGDPSIQDIFSM